MNMDLYQMVNQILSITRIKKLTLTLFILGSMVSCTNHDAVQLKVFTNINGYSFNNLRELNKFSSMVVKGGKIVAIGNDTILDKFTKSDLIDLEGQTMLPGITDAHGHVSSLGYTLMQIDLRDSESAYQAAKKIAIYTNQRPFLRWIQGRGWNQVLWPDKKFPNSKILDELVPNKPIWLERIDGHAGWANTKALELAGITTNTLSPPGGEILRDSSGKPTGILIDNAMDLVTKVIPPYDEKELMQAIEIASNHLISLGITSVHDAGVSAREHRIYRALADKEELLVRLYGMISSTDSELSTILSEGPVTDENDLYSARSVKVYTDGALGSRGAALLQPYSDRPDHTGLLLTSKQTLRDILEDAVLSGFQVAIHAIGDKGNQLALDEIEWSYSSVGGKELRHRVEHAQVVDLKDIPRFKLLNVIPSMQPTHATSDMNMAEDRIGAERLKGAYAWRTFIDQGSRLASGSDFPIELANPFYGIHAAVTRQNRQNLPIKGWISEQSISITEAIRSFTIDAAWAAHQETTLGSLEVGKWADFIIIDRDIFNEPQESIWKTKVLQTWIAGAVVYQKS